MGMSGRAVEVGRECLRNGRGVKGGSDAGGGRREVKKVVWSL